MNKILFVISTLEGGGAERTLSNIVTHFPDNWHVDILINNKSFIQYPYKGRILSLSLPGCGERKTILYFLREVIKRTFYLRKIKKENHYRACISFLPSSNISNVLSGNKYCKTIVSIHSNPINNRLGLFGKIGVILSIKLIYVHADKIISVSEEITSGLIRYLKISKGKTRTIINGYDSQWLRERMKVPPKNKKVEVLPANEQKIVITVGRMVEEKGQWHLIRAFSKVVKKEKNAKLLLIGDGLLKEYLEKLVNQYDLGGKVIFIGYTENPFWYYALADVFILPSLSEGYPNALVEAVCCGVPCIAADVHSGAREILAPQLDAAGKRIEDVSEEKYGVLIPVCSGQMYQHQEPLELGERKMAEAILKLLEDASKRFHYRQKSIERSKVLEMNTVIDKWIDVIV
ncbi:MAG: glycosyltransferase [Lachnospiraceae bacterium]|nr:glycosyltransferase [Lachnospiraceae bacterium]